MKYKKIMAVGILATLAASSLGATAVFADDEDSFGIDLTEIKDALEANDYEAFVSALSEIDQRAAEKMSEGIFERVVNNYEDMEAVHDAIETGEYSDWVDAMNELPGGEALVEVITEDEWESFKEFHDAKESGDMETAEIIAEEIGLQDFHEEREEAKQEKIETREAAHEALDNSDYDAWLDAISGTPAEEVLGDIIDEENFVDFVEVHELHQSGDHKAAVEAAQDLGLPEPKHRFGKMFHRMQGLVRGFFR
tara:strand:- start:5816 stop:6571 length:756 start_codon:yes stop_codon:yes gene_type:complete